MTAKRNIPDFTPEEIDALPNGPHIEHIIPLTLEDYARGMHGKTKVVTEYPPCEALWHAPGDPIAQRGTDGTLYSIGKWADGRYFKKAEWF